VKTVAIVVVVAALVAGSWGAAAAERHVGSLLETLALAWEVRDGALVAEIDCGIVELLLIEPDATMAWLIAHPKIAASLVKHWQHSVFKNLAGTKQRRQTLEDERAEAIRVLEAGAGGAAATTLRADMLARLRTMTVQEPY
jgi:hypothetical protein